MGATFHRGLAYVEDVLHALGCTALGAVLVLITTDALLRFVANETIEFQFEFTEMYLMPAMAALSLARVQRVRGHLAIEFVSLSWLGPFGAVLARMNHALPALFFALLTWQSGKYAWAAWVRDDIFMGTIDWPMYAAYVSIPVGTGVLTIRLIVDALSGDREQEQQQAH